MVLVIFIKISCPKNSLEFYFLKKSNLQEHSFFLEIISFRSVVVLYNAKQFPTMPCSNNPYYK